ncbi:MAG: ThuA domain-containing protein [Kiritimatiellae bacterium]|nr:ThuA domain-containing protein [Kiritimatiellia bacterium]
MVRRSMALVRDTDVSLRRDARRMVFKSTMRLLVGLTCAALGPLTLLVPAAEQREGCHIEEIYDQDGDLQVQCESEWFSMHIMPDMQSMIVRLIFRPTGNDILSQVQPKMWFGGVNGGGLLQDNFWGQDWRYSEFRGRPYTYKIVKNTREEVAATFDTLSEGWIQGVDSGLISRLWSNIRIKRTVRLRSQVPYFLFDLELSTEDKNAKLPLMWVHSQALCDPLQGDFVHRPSARGVRRIGKVGHVHWSKGDHYIYDFNEGWAAHVAPVRKEGLVYLMDYDYLNFLYNCGTATDEWVYDNVLITRERPWKGRTYILPLVGLSKVDFANEHFILAIDLRREGGRLELVYQVVASYEPVKRITFNTELGFGYGENEDATGSTVAGGGKTRKLDPADVEKLGVAPVEARVLVENPPIDPLLLTIKAYIELPDGTLKTKQFQAFYAGEYKTGDNLGLKTGKPLVKLYRKPLAPFIPPVPGNLSVNRKKWKIFAMLGNHSRRLQLREILRTIAPLDDNNNIGYTPGWSAGSSQVGLTDFPYDYERLFGYRVFVWANCNPEVTRRIGVEVLARYLQAGGGLVLTGGDNGFMQEFVEPPSALNAYFPVQPLANNVRRGLRQLNAAATNHPIFKGLDLTNLPYAYYTHEVELKTNVVAKVLLRAGNRPFIVESSRDNQRTMVVLCAPFGDETEFSGKTPYWKWKEWPRLMANVVRYAGHDL